MIVQIVWKRVSEKSAAIAFHPLTSHPEVENKDGASVIRAHYQALYVVNQLDDETTEVKWDYHINFGGKLPKALVNGFIIPNSNRVLSHTQAHFVNSVD